MNTNIKRFEMVELNVTANNMGKFGFNSVPQLRNQADQIIIIKGISVFPITSYAGSLVTPGVGGMPLIEIPKVTLVLYVNGEESVKSIPLSLLITVNDFAAPYQQIPYGFQDLQNVDIDKSYVYFSVAAAATPYVIPFGFHYDRLVKATNQPLMPNAAGGSGWVNA